MREATESNDEARGHVTRSDSEIFIMQGYKSNNILPPTYLDSRSRGPKSDLDRTNHH